MNSMNTHVKGFQDVRICQYLHFNFYRNPSLLSFGFVMVWVVGLSVGRLTVLT